MENTGRVVAAKITSNAPTLPEIGKIKIGEKKKNSQGTEYPSSLDYFKATGNYAAIFHQTLGDKPKKLSIVFISDNVSEVCNEEYQSWVKGKRWGWGNGEVFTVWDSVAKDYIKNVGKDDPRVKNLKWDLVLTMRFVLLGMKGIMGTWTFQTKGKTTTIPSIIKAFDFVRERAGTIISFPFDLMVEKVSGYSPEAPKNYAMVKLVPNFSQDAIDVVSEYIEQGGNMNKLTTKMIEQKQVLQIENKKEDNK